MKGLIPRPRRLFTQPRGLSTSAQYATVPGLLRSRPFSTSSQALRPAPDFTHVVIGGGVVGLAVARHLALRRNNHNHHSNTTTTACTAVLERHSAVGTETSARNSEVIHAGIYYPPTSLKTDLCIRGRALLYDFCARHGVAHRRTGKWIVAQTDSQRELLVGMHEKARALGVPLRWVGAGERAREEPCVKALDEHGTLESPETGIVDSHGLMACLAGQLEGAGGVVALRTAVLGVEPVSPGGGGWKIHVRSAGETDSAPDTTTTITAEVVVNAAGLGAVAVHNMLYPQNPASHLPAYFAKGTYFSYSPTAAGRGLGVKRLIYPVHPPGHGGLGTHLTLDLSGRVRFGPDVEWVTRADDLDARADRLGPAVSEIQAYLDGIEPDALAPDYAGMRPKLAPAKGGFRDFVVEKSDEWEGWVDLLGIESPGLTSALAIAERVGDLLYGSKGPST